VAQDTEAGSQGRLLLIHQDTEIRRDLTSGFQSAGYKVHAVVRMTSADKFLEGEQLDFIVAALDEGTGGFSVLRELRAKAPAVPSIALLHEGQFEDVRAAFRLGAHDVLKDPPRVAEIIASMGSLDPEATGSSTRVTDIAVQDVAVIHGDSSRRAMYVAGVGRLGHSVTGVASTDELRGGRGKSHPTILLFSVKCWRVSGVAFVRSLAEKGAATRVIVVGTHRTLRGEDELRAEGVQALLVDPVASLELDRQFQLLLGGSPAAEALGTEDVDTQRKSKARGSKSSEGGAKAAGRGAARSSSKPGGSPMREEVLELAQALRSGRARVSNISPVAMELQAMCAEGPPSMSELVEKIEQDPNLAAATLRAANSVAYRGMPRVIDIRAAGQRIGTRRLGEVAQTEAIKGVYQGRKDGWGPLFMKMWRHTVTTAHAARLLGEHLDMPNQGAIYSMALLHNIGEVLIVDLYRKAEYEAPKDGIASGPLVKDMNSRHAALGALLLKSWDFPPALSSIALAHHDPSELPDGTPLSRHAWLIGAMSSVAMAGPTLYKEVPDGGPPLPTAVTVLGTGIDEFDRIMEAAHKWWSSQGD
jgi:HD-like signal output (HDOD) protein/DNA-binding response OmpR family regulator